MRIVFIILFFITLDTLQCLDVSQCELDNKNIIINENTFDIAINSLNQTVSFLQNEISNGLTIITIILAIIGYFIVSIYKKYNIINKRYDEYKLYLENTKSEFDERIGMLNKQDEDISHKLNKINEMVTNLEEAVRSFTKVTDRYLNLSNKGFNNFKE